MRLIDADLLERELGIEDWDIWVSHLLEEAPTVDVVDRELYEQCKFDKDIAEEQLKKIVRCKDCKWWQMVDDYDGVYGQCKHLRSVIKKSVFVNENFFCADGERKKEEWQED